MSPDQIVAVMSEQWALTVAQLAQRLGASRASAKRQLRRELRRLHADGVIKPADHHKPTSWVLEMPESVRRWITSLPSTPARAPVRLPTEKARP